MTSAPSANTKGGGRPFNPSATATGPRFAINALPAVLADAITLPRPATGTDGKAAACCLSNAWPSKRSSVESGGMQNAAPEGEAAFLSEGDGTRTRNHRIDSPVL